MQLSGKEVKTARVVQGGLHPDDFPDTPSVCWNGRPIDIDGLRRWLAKRIAKAVMEEIKKEQPDGHER